MFTKRPGPRGSVQAAAEKTEQMWRGRIIRTSLPLAGSPRQIALEPAPPRLHARMTTSHCAGRGAVRARDGVSEPAAPFAKSARAVPATAARTCENGDAYAADACYSCLLSDCMPRRAGIGKLARSTVMWRLMEHRRRSTCAAMDTSESRTALGPRPVADGPSDPPGAISAPIARHTFAAHCNHKMQ